MGPLLLPGRRPTAQVPAQEAEATVLFALATAAFVSPDQSSRNSTCTPTGLRAAVRCNGPWATEARGWTPRCRWRFTLEGQRPGGAGSADRGKIDSLSGMGDDNNTPQPADPVRSTYEPPDPGGGTVLRDFTASLVAVYAATQSLWTAMAVACIAVVLVRDGRW